MSGEGQTARTVRHWDNAFYQHYRSARGVITISVCEDAKDTPEYHTAVLGHALGDVDQKQLSGITPQRIDEPTFHGTWFDYEKELLVYKGIIRPMGRKAIRVDPYLKDITGKVSAIPQAHRLWTPGGLAYAFCAPPYRLLMTRPEIQTSYSAIIAEIAPKDQVNILNWHQEYLLKTTPELEMGAE